MLKYEQMTMLDIQKLPRERTVFWLTLSPIEIHGPHLPTGTDVLIAEKIQRGAIDKAQREFQDYEHVMLPPLYLGADPLPASGSLGIPARALESIVVSLGSGLAKLGFHYLVINDNHGGPRHQLAIASAVRSLWKRNKFHCICPFIPIYKAMVLCDGELLKSTGLTKGACGDDTDSHAGTNETSLFMAATGCTNPGVDVDPSIPPMANRFIRIISGLSKDLAHICNTLTWISDPAMKPYMGAPQLADTEAGQRMLSYHIYTTLSLLKRAIDGEAPIYNSILWAFRFMRYFG